MKVWIISATIIAILISAFIIINKPQTPQTPVSAPTPEDKNLLDKEIKQNDQILVKFTPK